jgi:hypothetical protein
MAGDDRSVPGIAFLCTMASFTFVVVSSAATSTSSQILASTSRTDAANHLPPRAVGMPQSFRALAMARSEVAPLTWSSAITG